MPIVNSLTVIENQDSLRVLLVRMIYKLRDLSEFGKPPLCASMAAKMNGEKKQRPEANGTKNTAHEP